VAAGYTTDSVTSLNFALARFNSDGTLDISFGAGGKVTTDFTGGYDYANSLAVQRDGKIVVAGVSNNDFALARYNSNGKLDTGFGVGGKVTTDFAEYFDWARAVAVQSNGKIVVAGQAGIGNPYGEFGLARYNSDGALDTGFGAGGKVVTDFAGSNDFAFSVAVQPDGKIVAAGFADIGGTGYDRLDFALARCE
jgi:uncharacterized delta-60 repeat protein